MGLYRRKLSGDRYLTDFVLNMGSDIETEPRTYFVRWASKIGHNDEEEEEDHEHDEDDENKGDDREDREDRKEKQDREN